jgi:DNA repair protein RadC
LTLEDLLKANRIAEDDILAAAEAIATAQRRRRPQLTSAREIARHIRARLHCADRECFYTLTADQKNRLIRLHLVTIGTLTEALVHPREVFRPAIEDRAAAVALAHNHPSGDPRPSAQDIALTVRMREAAALLGFRLLDHVIVGDGEHYSFAEAGRI